MSRLLYLSVQDFIGAHCLQCECDIWHIASVLETKTNDDVEYFTCICVLLVAFLSQKHMDV